ncbi:MAG TPA: type II secretion system protein [Candidatus Paceibacterota bacterium]
MVLRKVCTHETVRRGFTLVEILVATGIVIMLLSAGLVFSMSDYRTSSFNREVQTVVTLLQTARSKAMHNINETPHGVALYPHDHPQAYVLFEGPSYGNGIVIDVIGQEYHIIESAESTSEIIFEQLSGSVTTPRDIAFFDEARGASTFISVNAEGRINW